MEQMLGGFQSDLHSISSEIQTLQQRSLAMNIKLRNRKVRRMRGGPGPHFTGSRALATWDPCTRTCTV